MFMLYMVIEHYKDRDPKPVYDRLQKNGRMFPEGLRYISSWVESNYDRCFQLMECDEPSLLEVWTSRWSDLVNFEIVPVVTSAQAAEKTLDA
jgi:Protein of unknown function (DUF3303)